VRACMCGCVRVCVRACMRVCVRACEHACVHACVCAYVRACELVLCDLFANDACVQVRGSNIINTQLPGDRFSWRAHKCVMARNQCTAAPNGQWECVMDECVMDEACQTYE